MHKSYIKMRFCRQPAAGEKFLGCFPPPGSGPLGGEIFFSPQNPDPWGGNAFFIPPPRGGRNKHPCVDHCAILWKNWPGRSQWPSLGAWRIWEGSSDHLQKIISISTGRCSNPTLVPSVGWTFMTLRKKKTQPGKSEDINPDGSKTPKKKYLEDY